MVDFYDKWYQVIDSINDGFNGKCQQRYEFLFTMVGSTDNVWFDTHTQK